MNRGLYDLVVSKLDEASMDRAVARLVQAACADDAGLARALAEPDSEVTAPAGEGPVGVGALGLRRLTVCGFRGIGAAAELRLEAGPGLTVVAGRNGSGKSSLAEALELLLYGGLSRWEGKSKEWKKGWTNIHADGAVFIEAELVVGGSAEPLVVRREWSTRSSKPSAGTLTARQGDRALGPEALPGEETLSLYRPILSYGDLGRRLEGKPSELFDDVAGMLGLEELTSGWKRIQRVRRELGQRHERLRADAAELRERLAPLEDPRAAETLRALSQEPWDLDSLREVVHGRGESASELAQLRHAAGLEIPETHMWAAACAELEAALGATRTLAGTHAGECLELMRLLGAALALHGHAGDTEGCPVCEGDRGLDTEWRRRAEARVRQLGEDARAATVAEARVHEAYAELSEMSGFLDEEDLELALELGLSEDAQAAWRRWTRAADERDAGALIAHVRAHAEGACRAGIELRELATLELERRNEAWNSFAERLEEWLVRARRSLEEDDAGTVARLLAAEEWLRDAENQLRHVRFAPIAHRARGLWEQMRQDSNVSLESVTLAAPGGDHRRLELQADVDATGTKRPALALMSQGELNVMALSLFLPRVLLDETPFRFVVLDDPVQAMDPHKVDGLARVLEDVAKTRQVIVFTHDPRLLEAIDRLDVAATVMQVTREAQSRIDIREVSSPVSSYLAQADRMLEPHNADAMGEERLRRIVPTACRMALEAALQKVARRRLLGAGSSHAEAEALLGKVKATIGLAAIALFGDARRGGDVHRELESRFAGRAGAYRVCVEQAHGAWDGDLRALVGDVRRLAKGIEAIA